MDNPNTLKELGEKFVKLGKALQNPQTDIRELTELAFDCGIDLKIEVVSKGDLENGSKKMIVVKKYVVVQGDQPFSGEEIILFNLTLNHSRFKSLNPISAGKAVINTEDSSNSICKGKSVALDIESRGDDDTQLLREFNKFW